MIFSMNMLIRAKGLYEMKRHYQSANHLRQGHWYRDKYFPEAVSSEDTRISYGDRLAAERKIYMD